jgi:hypothetical protein
MRQYRGKFTKTDLAYIAGFLDGDGSLMLQLKKRKDGKSKARFMVTICFYQDSRYQKELVWIQSVLNSGYISHRKDGMSELRINGYKQVKDILILLQPFVRFKKLQLITLLKAVKLLEAKSITKLTVTELKSLVEYIIQIQGANYTTKYKRSKTELYKVLGITL